jgi:tRNA1Val (adenine37-N6)-methyltransferase
MPIYMARKSHGNEMVGVEVQDDLFRVSLKNKDLNNCENIRFIQGDINSLSMTLKRAPFHVIISNPPYTKERTGRASPYPSRLLARSETSLTLNDLLKASSSLLFKKGRFYVIYPSRRLGELIGTARSFRLEVKRLRFVYPRKDEKANLFLAEFVKEGGIGAIIEQPLYIYENSSYTEEAKSYYILQG